MNARSLKTALIALAAMALVAETGSAQPQDVLWARILVSKSFDQCNSVQQTADGGYIMGGWTDSSITGHEDMYLQKADAQGNLEWRKTFGGNDDDYCESVRQTADGGYILGGWTYSFGAGNYDMYLVKTDAYGHLEWQRTFGGPCGDYCYSVQQTTDGGYILGGATRQAFTAPCDMVLVKTDAFGNLQWERSFGGGESDVCYSVQQTADGGYVLGGDSDSFGAGPFDHDMYLVKTDAHGNLQWQKTFGGGESDGCYSVRQTADGGYILGGDSESFGPSPFDVYLVKSDANGHMEWQRTFGGDGWDDCYSVQQTADGGYILGGYSDSFGAGDFDMYLIKTDSQGSLRWQRILGGSENDFGYSIQQTDEGSYVIAGYTESSGVKGDDMKMVCVEEVPASFPNVTVPMIWPVMTSWAFWQQNLPMASAAPVAAR